jgi:hypothetical protein
MAFVVTNPDLASRSVSPVQSLEDRVHSEATWPSDVIGYDSETSLPIHVHSVDGPGVGFQSRAPHTPEHKATVRYHNEALDPLYSRNEDIAKFALLTADTQLGTGVNEVKISPDPIPGQMRRLDEATLYCSSLSLAGSRFGSNDSIFLLDPENAGCFEVVVHAFHVHVL